MSEFAVTAIGRDRPGIVAAVSGALLELGGNVEDSRMAILRGHFAVMLIVEVPDEAGREQLEAELERVRDELGLEAVSVSEVERLDVASDGPSHVLTVYGADRPGIVHGVATLLAERGVNVTDLETRVTGAGAPVYVMVMELALGEVDAGDLNAALGEAATALEVDVSLRPMEAEEL